VRWTGKTPFEMHEVKVTKDGFTISFTEPLKDDAAADIQNYSMKAWTYQYRSKYGSQGTLENLVPKVTSAIIAEDKLSVRIIVDKLTLGHLHQITLSDQIQSSSEKKLWHKEVFYTLNELRD